MRDQFLVELTESRLDQVSDLAELNRLFTAWVETVYHPGVHSETGAPPLRRWSEGVPDPLPHPSPAALREAFLWSEYRTVTKTATVSLHAATYQVDELLIGRGQAATFVSQSYTSRLITAERGEDHDGESEKDRRGRLGDISARLLCA